MTRAVTFRRAVIVPGLTTLVIVSVLLALGAWQLQRKSDKLAMIAMLGERLSAAPVFLPPVSAWRELTPPRDEFRRVTVTGEFVVGANAQVFASGSPLRKDVTGTGVWLFAPFRLASGDVVVVNRGFVAEGQNAAPSAGPATLTGYIRFAEQPGWLTPAEDRVRRLWFVRDPRAMSELLGWAAAERLAPFYLDLESPVPPTGVPKPGPLTVNLKDDHLQYAITWFSLAFAVVIAFAVWCRAERRRSRG